VESKNHPVLEQLDSGNLTRGTDAFRQGIKRSMATVICSSDTIWSASRPESNLGNWAADAALWQARNLIKDTLIISLLNKGGLRSTLPKGNINRGNFFELMPFENRLSIVQITRDSFKSLLNFLKIKGGEPMAGFTFNNTDHLSSKFENGQIILQDTLLPWIVTSDYLANGGDYMTFFLNPISRKDFSIGIRDAFINYAKHQQNLSIQLTQRWYE
jgi:2',3'-cyclic-nucleotide 2'-phosphodiesterase (5'-nucleotidase family)